MSNLLENTKIFKCVHSGWTAKTMVEHLGHVYQINTSKGSSNQITSSYCKVNQSGGTVSFWLTDLTVFLRDSGRATEKSIKESHSKALTLFEKVKDEIQSNQKTNA